MRIQLEGSVTHDPKVVSPFIHWEACSSHSSQDLLVSSQESQPCLAIHESERERKGALFVVLMIGGESPHPGMNISDNSTLLIYYPVEIMIHYKTGGRGPGSGQGTAEKQTVGSQRCRNNSRSSLSCLLLPSLQIAPFQFFNMRPGRSKCTSFGR